jgi:hypothetical protein
VNSLLFVLYSCFNLDLYIITSNWACVTRTYENLKLQNMDILMSDEVGCYVCSQR